MPDARSRDTSAELPEHRLRALWALLAGQRGRALAAATAIVCATAASLAPPYLAGRVVDAAAHHRGNGTIALLAAAFLASSALVFATSRAQTLLVGIVGQAVLRDLRVRAFGHLLRQPLAYHHRVATGTSLSRLTNDVQALDQLLSDGAVTFVSATLTLVGLAVVLFLLDPTLAALAFGFALPVLAAGLWFRSASRAAYRITRERIAAITAYIQQTLAAIRTSKLFVQEKRHLRELAELGESNVAANMRTVRLNAAYFPGVELLTGLATVVVVVVGGKRVLDGATSIGTLAAFVFYLQNFFDPVQQLSQLHTTYQAGVAGLDRVLELLRREPELDDPPRPRPLRRARPAVRIVEASYSYDGAHRVLHGVSLALAPGRTVALVGPTGAGKTTLARLACRLIDPDDGAVLVDGIDARELAQAELRRRVLLVPQEPFLFPGTIAENIALGDARAGRSAVEDAARAVGVHATIERLPAGYDTDVGEAGGRLSAGERQLVCLARAVLADPAILILDEASSAVDAATEAHVRAALARLSAGRGVLVIAHRLAGTVRADEIAVLEHGRLVERGSHRQLLAAGGAYARLWRAWVEGSSNGAGAARL
ncbi:ABC transporter ATP-binding protein [Thermoleophilum album]|uniref:ABC transporter ATP-binding protein n=1 Tax=Thermoleophilum album TaxID=29539 RepID=UPI00237CDF6B|nr:ABC transporter ATP-binding protein [Thermoleophilum album]WDT92919.1 ABC transporter ATP-binding protein [Thermoleophilum album]